jgi:hypothetical protein
MAFTDYSDLFSAVHEEGINYAVSHIMLQRPSLFNYATYYIIKNPSLLCKPINHTKDVKNDFLLTEEDPLPVLGTNGSIALNFCFQITKLEVDFYPGKLIKLPAELNPLLKPQHFAFHARICGGIGCPLAGEIDKIPPPPLTHPQEKPPSVPPTVPYTRKIECFYLDLFVVGHAEVTGVIGDRMLVGKVDGLEIVDIEPQGLENSFECYLNMLIQLVILPRTSIAIEKLVLSIFNNLSLSPLSASIQHNPAMEDDQIKVYIDVGVTP